MIQCARSQRADARDQHLSLTVGDSKSCPSRAADIAVNCALMSAWSEAPWAQDSVLIRG